MASKRKAGDENPLLNPNKRNKTDKARPTRSKIPNGEQQPSGLVIVRAASIANDALPSSRPTPSTSQSNPLLKSSRPSSQPPPSQSQPSTSRTKLSSSQQPCSTSRDISTVSGDPALIEKDVRAMDDESDEYRRQSRARTTIHPSLFTNTQRPGDSSSPKPKSSRRAMSVDITQPVPTSESPIIQRNKSLRQDSMDVIKQGNMEEGSHTPSGHRRRSSGRIRASMESSGSISQPHSSVSDTVFHKHIPSDLPEAERLRLALNWVSTRVNSSQSSALSSKEVSVAQKMQDRMLRALSERRVDTCTSMPREPNELPKQKNEQNEFNRRSEVTYAQQIRTMQQEQSAWEEARRFHESCIKKGKQRASEIEVYTTDWIPRQLSQYHLDGRTLARATMEYSNDQDLQQSIRDFEFNMDLLHSHLNRAQATTSTAEQMLDARFARLAIEANHAPLSMVGDLLMSGTRDHDPQELLRALARVDRGRPPAKVGDAARRAMREVQRVEEKGIGAVGERRLTGVPQTPRTPRRGSTPGRDR